MAYYEGDTLRTEIDEGLSPSRKPSDIAIAGRPRVWDERTKRGSSIGTSSPGTS